MTVIFLISIYRHSSIIQTFYRKDNYKTSTALTFWGKPIATRRQRKLFEESRLQPVDSANFLMEADCKPSIALTF